MATVRMSMSVLMVCD